MIFICPPQAHARQAVYTRSVTTYGKKLSEEPFTTLFISYCRPVVVMKIKPVNLVFAIVCALATCGGWYLSLAVFPALIAASLPAAIFLLWILWLVAVAWDFTSDFR